jgi:hypothetical protein
VVAHTGGGCARGEDIGDRPGEIRSGTADSADSLTNMSALKALGSRSSAARWLVPCLAGWAEDAAPDTLAD